MAGSWEDLDLNDLRLAELRITPPPPPPPRGPTSQGGATAATSNPTQPGVKREGSGDALTDCAAENGVDKILMQQLQDPKDRVQVLRMEVEVESFIQDTSRERLEFAAHLSPFQRMLAHRVAQHHNLQTSVASREDGEPHGQVVAQRTVQTGEPVLRLLDIPCAEGSAQVPPGAEVKNVRLMRRTPSAENASSSGSLSLQAVDDESLARAVQEREEAYNKARQRIFSSGNLADEVEAAAASPSSSLAVETASQTPVVPAETVPAPESSSKTSSAPEQPQLVETSAQEPRVRSQGNSREGSGRRVGQADDQENSSKAGKGRQRGGSKAGKAVFRDKDKDAQDPDFQRGRRRYEPRFDAGYGIAPQPMAGQQGFYAMPTYGSEFPTLGGAPQPVPSSSGHMMGPAPVPHMMPGMHMPSGPGQAGAGWPGMVPHQVSVPMAQPPHHMGGQPHAQQYSQMPAGYHPGQGPQPGMYHPQHPIHYGMPMPPGGHYGFPPDNRQGMYHGFSPQMQQHMGCTPPPQHQQSGAPVVTPPPSEQR